MSTMKAHEIDYAVLGDDIQAVEIELDPGETVIAEAGAMNYMEEGITFESKMGDGTDANAGMMNKLFGVGKRLMAGESMMITHFTNSGAGKQKVCFAAPYPGKIIPLNLAELGGTVLCQRQQRCRGPNHGGCRPTDGPGELGPGQSRRRVTAFDRHPAAPDRCDERFPRAAARTVADRVHSIGRGNCQDTK